MHASHRRGERRVAHHRARREEPRRTRSLGGPGDGRRSARGRAPRRQRAGHRPGPPRVHVRGERRARPSPRRSSCTRARKTAARPWPSHRARVPEPSTSAPLPGAATGRRSGQAIEAGGQDAARGRRRRRGRRHRRSRARAESSACWRPRRGRRPSASARTTRGVRSQAMSDRSSAVTGATASTVGFIAGGVLLAGGRYPLLHRAEGRRPARRPRGEAGRLRSERRVLEQ